jgi:hypothetical protein
MLLAAVLTPGVSLQAVDLGPLVRQYEATCGIKVVGYHIAGRPGQQFAYAGETFTLPAEGYIEVISLPRVKHYTFEGRKLPLEDGVSPLDPFSFRWITLPASSPDQRRNP